MALAPGTRLGPYEIADPLGAGGMGEVYRAHDSRLGRDVAVKVLPQHLSAQPEVRARFEREARTVSALNHPHICTLHDVGREGDTDFLVMELVEGETLAMRLARGPLPTDDLLRIGAQIADALDRAHRAGVIHRDLKPGNIMLARSGAKLMDFGLARAAGMTGTVATASAALTQSPTVAQPLTAEGTIVGTFQYLAPEQLEGKEADARSDLWALGCVLYEMATGKRAFEGATQASLISAIMRDVPRPMADLAPMSPPGLERLVLALLAKDPAERVQTAHDAKLQLGWIRDAGSQVGATAAVALAAAPSARAAHERGWWIAAMTVVVAGAAAAVLLLRGGGETRAIHASLLPPADGQFSSSITNPLPLAISPDGARVAFCARIGEGPDMLWVRALDSPEPRPLAGTENAQGPFFSPDGNSLGFFADGKLNRVDVAGGPVIVLASAPDPRGGTWSRDGVILFTPDSETQVLRVRADGGAVSAATVLDSVAGERTHRYPVFLPDGKHFLFLARRAGAGAGIEPTIYAGSLDSPERTEVVAVASNVQYASGHLLYVRGGILVAQPFDPGRLATRGPAVPIVDDLQWDERFSRGVFAASANGVLAFLTGQAETRTRLQWLDRSGRRLATVGEPADYTYGGTPSVSPDGRLAAMPILNPDRGTSSIWIVDLSTGRRRRLTVDQTDHAGCIWSHDGRRVLFNCYLTTTPTSYTIVARAVDGAAADTVYRDRDWVWANSASPDGRFALVQRGTGDDGRTDLVAAPLSNAVQERGVATGRGAQRAGQFSPDGRLVAYSSDESGRTEVYVVTFPEPAGKWQVSQEGGDEPRWSRDGRELFYVDRENRIVSVEVVRTSAGFEAGMVRGLFPFHGAGGYPRYDVSPDGSRFLVTAPVEDRSPQPVSIVTNWPGRLRER